MIGDRPTSRAGRVVRFLTRGPVQVILVVVGLLWLVPTFGLLLSSFRPVAEATSSGWWTSLTNPSQLTVENYSRLVSNEGMVSSLWNTLFITAPSAILLGESAVSVDVRSTESIVGGLVQALTAQAAADEPAAIALRDSLLGRLRALAGAEQLLLWVDSALKAYRSALATEKHRMGLQYILDITPDLHRLQPVDELLQGLLWQVEGLVGAENCFLATYSSPELARVAASAAKAESLEGFVALADSTSERSQMEIRVGTGRFRAGLSTESLPDAHVRYSGHRWTPPVCQASNR